MSSAAPDAATPAPLPEPTSLLWVSGPPRRELPPRWQQRYQAIAPQVWIDRFPQRPCGEGVPISLLPYLTLFDLQAHLPSLYGCDDGEAERLVLLGRVPLTPEAALLPDLPAVLAGASALRQTRWLAQHIGLWSRLAEQGVAVSLLRPDNLRVDGTDLRLLELYGRRDAPLGISRPGQEQATLAELAWLWGQWLPGLDPALRDWLAPWLSRLSESRDPLALQEALEQRARELAAALPLSLRIAARTDAGPQRDHNEDACHPQPGERSARWLAVCDGLGGHAGGEEASRMALEVIRPRLEALVSEATGAAVPLDDARIRDWLTRIVLEANEAIFRHNDQRSGVSRMGTTLVLALHLPHRLANGDLCHDLHLVNVGDSRAYWMTGDRCRQLTLDDDVATQLTRQQQATYHQASLDGSNGALTQALGIFPSATLRVAVQRLPIEEEGILFLCSDGVSDFDLVERFAVPEARRLLAGEIPLAAWTEAWIARANQLNGHDNATVAAMHCSLTAPPPEPEPEPPVAIRPRPHRPPVRLDRDLLGLVGGFGAGLVLTTLVGLLQPPTPPLPLNGGLSPTPVGK